MAEQERDGVIVWSVVWRDGMTSLMPLRDGEDTFMYSQLTDVPRSATQFGEKMSFPLLRLCTADADLHEASIWLSELKGSARGRLFGSVTLHITAGLTRRCHLDSSLAVCVGDSGRSQCFAILQIHSPF